MYELLLALALWEHPLVYHFFRTPVHCVDHDLVGWLLAAGEKASAISPLL